MEINDFNEFNRVLLVMAELETSSYSRIHPDKINEHCKSLSFGGRPRDHIKTMDLAHKAGLINKIEDEFEISSPGKDFLKLNPSSQYELTNEQHTFLIMNIFLKGLFFPEVVYLFRCFKIDLDKETLCLDLLSCTLPKQVRSLCYVLTQLGLLIKAGDIFYANKEYLPLLKDLPSSGSGLTPAMLRKMLEEQEKIGEIAETLVFKYEKTRLNAIGSARDAAQVKHISLLDSNKGYDIASFDGTTPSIDFNRFIEVKGTSGSKFRFFWSKNEYETAKKLGDTYWIYFISNVNEKTTAIKPIIIKNPAKILHDLRGITISTAKFLVEEETEGFIPSIGKEQKITEEVYCVIIDIL